MRNVCIFLVSLMCGLSAWAQEGGKSGTFFSTKKSDEKVSLGVRVGVNSSTMALGMGNGSRSVEQGRVGFGAGVSVDVPILESLGFQTGVYFVQKGFREKEETVVPTWINGISVIAGGTQVKTMGNPGYLELPLLASYRYDFNGKVRLLVNTGPYVAYGVCGKMSVKVENNQGVKIQDNSVDWFGGADSNDSMRFRRFDLGWHLGAGLKFKGGFTLGYVFEAGFLDIGRLEGYSAKTRCHLVNVGFSL